MARNSIIFIVGDIISSNISTRTYHFDALSILSYIISGDMWITFGQDNSSSWAEFYHIFD